MRITLISVWLIAVLVYAVSGQSESDFKKKYETRDFFEIRPKILMNADYNSGGEVCSVIFQPNFYSLAERTRFVGNTSIDLNELLSVIDEVAPVETRKGKGISLGSLLQGGMHFGGFTFDNIRINTMSPGHKRRPSERIFIDELTVAQRNANADLIAYLNSMGSPETASITWITRKDCK